MSAVTIPTYRVKGSFYWRDRMYGDGEIVRGYAGEAGENLVKLTAAELKKIDGDAPQNDEEV
jgi:hypothetical protein